MSFKNTKVSSKVKLEPMTLGYLRYMRSIGGSLSIFGLVDQLVLAHVEQFVEDNGLDREEVDKKAMRLFKQSRSPQSQARLEESNKMVELSYNKVRATQKKKAKQKQQDDYDVFGGAEISKDTLKGNW